MIEEVCLISESERCCHVKATVRDSCEAMIRANNKLLQNEIKLTNVIVDVSNRKYLQKSRHLHLKPKRMSRRRVLRKNYSLMTSQYLQAS